MRAMKVDYERSTEIVEVDVPMPNENDVQVKVIWSAVDIAVGMLLDKDWTSWMIRVLKDPLILGWHFSGRVTGVGSKVTDFHEGDEVFGHLQYESKTDQGTFAEYITIAQSDLAHKPTNITFDTAAASTTESMTALQALRDIGQLQKGKHVLINGAGGAVGSVSVQVAKILGANVTAICSEKDVERIQTLGADRVINRSVHKDPLRKASDIKYDVIFDIAAVFPMRALRRLKKHGVYIVPSFNKTLFLGGITTFFTTKKTKFVACRSKKDDLELIGEWIEDGKLKIEIDSTYKVANLKDALTRLNEQNKVGRIMIEVENGWTQ